MERAFDGVFIPTVIWLNDELSANEKMIFAEIHSLDGENHCYASNEYLADFCKVSIPTVTRAISHLKLLGYIEEVSNNGRTRVLKSNLKLINLMSHPNQIDEADSSICENLHYIENKKENNIEKAPAEPALSSTKSRRRDMISRSTNTLVDDLESGKDIDKQTSEQKKERKKKLEEDKAKARINKTEFSQEVKDLLYQFFLQSYHSNSDRRMRSAKDLEGKFNQLRKLIEQGQDAERVIQQSIENNWNALYDLRPVNKTNKSHEASMAICKEPTEEELRAWKESDLHF